jgi:hypothetical protein
MERREPLRFSPNPAILTLPSRKPTGILSSPLPLPMRREQRIGPSSKGSINCRSSCWRAGTRPAPSRTEPGSSAAGQACPSSRWRTSGPPGFSPHESIIPVPSRPWVTAGRRRHLPAGDEGHRGSPGNSAMRGDDPRRAHAIPAPARVAAVSRLQRRDGAHPRDPAGRIPLRTTHLRVPRVQRCRYPSSPMKPLAAAPRLVPMPLVRIAARPPAG